MPSPSAATSSSPKWFPLVLGAVAFMLYCNTFNNGYVLDDRSAIVENKIVTQGVSAIPHIFSTPYLRGYTVNSNDLYRPIPLAMFAIEYQLCDGSPVAGHVVNVILFACCVLLLFFFLDDLFGNKTQLAFFTALLFALHPIHTEVVANIKSRDELLCFFFAFMALRAIVKYLRSGKPLQLVFATLFYFLSLLSKETSITFIFIVPVVVFYCHSKNKKYNISVIACTLFSALVFLGIRYSVLSAHHANNTFEFNIAGNALAAAPSAAIRIATAVYMLGRYLILLVVPYPLVCDYSYSSIPFVSFSNIWVLVSLLTYLLLIAICLYRLFRFRSDVAAFSILLFLITLSLFSNVFFLVGATMAERFLFFPSAGFCLLPALMIDKLAGSNFKKKGIILIVVAIPCFVLIFFRNHEWKDAYTLYRSDARKNPNSFRLHYYLGSTLINNANEETDIAIKSRMLYDGINSLKRSLAIYPAFNSLYSEIGNSYLKLVQYDSAAPYLLHAVSLNPGDSFSVNELAALYFKTGKYRESVFLCNDLVKRYPAYARGYRNMGSCYIKLGIYDSAIIVLKRSLELEPNRAGYNYLSTAYQLEGQLDSANKYKTFIAP